MSNPTSDEEVLAAFAHASVLFSFLGPIGPTLIWVYQRNKSKYVRFHALQAMGYQTFAFWAWFVGIFVLGFGILLLTVLLEGLVAGSTSKEMPFAPFLLQPIIFLGIFGLWGLFFVIGVIGAVFCMLNRDFNYPLMGRWLRTKLFDERNTDVKAEEWEDNWVSGVCHATAILQIWGIITPLIVWFSQKQRSARIRFQALQAIIYQSLALVASVIGMVAYMAVFFVMFAGLAFSGFAAPASSGNGELSPVFGIIMFIFIAIMMIFWLFMMIAVPIYYLLAAVASIFTIRGHNFRYPVLGWIVSKRLNVPAKTEMTPS